MGVQLHAYYCGECKDTNYVFTGSESEKGAWRVATDGTASELYCKCLGGREEFAAELLETIKGVYGLSSIYVNSAYEDILRDAGEHPEHVLGLPANTSFIYKVSHASLAALKSGCQPIQTEECASVPNEAEKSHRCEKALDRS